MASRYSVLSRNAKEDIRGLNPSPSPSARANLIREMTRNNHRKGPSPALSRLSNASSSDTDSLAGNTTRQTNIDITESVYDADPTESSGRASRTDHAESIADIRASIEKLRQNPQQYKLEQNQKPHFPKQTSSPEKSPSQQTRRKYYYQAVKDGRGSPSYVINTSEAVKAFPEFSPGKQSSADQSQSIELSRRIPPEESKVETEPSGADLASFDMLELPRRPSPSTNEESFVPQPRPVSALPSEIMGRKSTVAVPKHTDQTNIPGDAVKAHDSGSGGSQDQGREQLQQERKKKPKTRLFTSDGSTSNFLDRTEYEDEAKAVASKSDRADEKPKKQVPFPKAYHSKEDIQSTLRRLSAAINSQKPKSSRQQNATVSTAQTNPETQTSTGFPDLPNITELVSGIFEDGTPVFSRTGKARIPSRFSTSSRAGRKSRLDHAEMDEVPIADEEEPIYLQIKLLQEQVAKLAREKAEAETAAHEHQEKAHQLEAAIKEERRHHHRRDSGLGNSSGSDGGGEESGRGSRKSIIEKTRLESTIRSLQDQQNILHHKLNVATRENRDLTIERDECVATLSKAFITHEELKLEISQLQGVYDDVYEKNEKLIENADQLLQENNNLKGEFNELLLDYEQLRADRKKVFAENNLLIVENEQLIADRQKHSTENKQHQKASENSHKEVKAKPGQLRGENDRLKAESEKLNAEDKKRENASCENRWLKSQVDEISDQNRRLKTTIRDLESQLETRQVEDYRREPSRKHEKRMSAPANIIATDTNENLSGNLTRETREVSTRQSFHQNAGSEPRSENGDVTGGNITVLSDIDPRAMEEMRRQIEAEYRSRTANNIKPTPNIQAPPAINYATKPQRQTSILASINDSHKPTTTAASGLAVPSTSIVGESKTAQPTKSSLKPPRAEPAPASEAGETNFDVDDFTGFSRGTGLSKASRFTTRSKASNATGVSNQSRFTARSKATSRAAAEQDDAAADESMLEQENRRQGRTMEDMTSGYLVEDITMGTSKNHKNKKGKAALTATTVDDDAPPAARSQNTNKNNEDSTNMNIKPATREVLDRLAPHESDGCGVCEPLMVHGSGAHDDHRRRHHHHRRQHATAVAAAAQIPRPVPVSERMPSPGPLYDEEPTLRPSQPPALALASVLHGLEQDLALAKAELAEQQRLYGQHDPALSKRRRKAVHDRIQVLLEEVDEKADRIYSLYDVVEGQKERAGGDKGEELTWQGF